MCLKMCVNRYLCPITRTSSIHSFSQISILHLENEQQHVEIARDVMRSRQGRVNSKSKLVEISFHNCKVTAYKTSLGTQKSERQVKVMFTFGFE